MVGVLIVFSFMIGFQSVFPMQFSCWRYKIAHYFNTHNSPLLYQFSS